MLINLIAFLICGICTAVLVTVNAPWYAIGFTALGSTFNGALYIHYRVTKGVK